METEQQSEMNANRSLLGSPFFWVGSGLWLVVLAAITGMWYQQRLKIAQTPTEPNVVAPKQDDSPDGQPKTIVIKTNNDGSLSVDDSGQAASESPWDKDGIADFAFTDTEGQTVTKADLLGKPWIVCFVFTHCAATCPTVTKSMRELQDYLKDYDFRLVTITVDPERDTAEILKRYGQDRGADFGRWSFLTGDQREIYTLIHGSFKMPVQETFGEKRQPGFEFIHSNNIMLVDEQGVVQGKYDATKGEAMAALRRELQHRARRLTNELKTN